MCCFVCERFLTSRNSTHLLATSLDTSFVLTLISIGQKALTFQRVAVIDKKLCLMTTCTGKLKCLVFFCLFGFSKNHLRFIYPDEDTVYETKMSREEITVVLF